MKGKTMIQLFDAESGKEVDRKEDNNLITNAVKDFMEQRLKDLDSWLMYRNNGERNYPYMRPLRASLDKMYKGLVLFGETLTADANEYFLTENKSIIGYAGGDYALSNPLRGDWNDTESVLDLENKKMTLVWDFDTDKANGTTYCACLCPQQAGDAGWGTDSAYFVADTTQSAMLEHGNHLDDYRHADVEAYADGYAQIGNTDGDIMGFIGDYMYYTFDNNSSPEIYRVPITQPGEAINPFVFEYPASELIGEYFTEASRVAQMLIADGVMYAVEIYTSTNETKLYSVDVTDLSKTLVCTVDTALDVETSDNGHMCFIDGYLYMLSDDRASIFKVNASTGAYIETISGVPSGVDYIRNWKGMLMAGDNGYSDSDYYSGKFWTYDGTTWSKEKRGGFIQGNTVRFFRDISHNKFLVMGTNASYTNYVYFMYDLCFLTTINNLATPVTKDNTQTMKVTYTLSW